VVNGTARVTRDAETLILRENESVYLPLGCAHRLENPGLIPLTLIEVAVRRVSRRDDNPCGSRILTGGCERG